MSLIYFLFTLGILVLVHEFGHFIAARRVGVRVEKFSFGFGPKLFSVKRGDTEYLISLIPLGGYVKLAGDDPAGELKNEKWEFLSKSVGERFQIIFAGPLLNYILAFFIFSFIFMFGSPTVTTEVGSLLKGYPAEKSGLKPGDRIVAINDKDVRYWEDATAIIHKSTEGAIKVSYERDGRVFEKSITPAVRETKDIFGKEVKLALIGIAPSDKIENIRYGFPKAFYMGGKKLWNLTTITCKALLYIVTGRLSMKDSMTGPIGIFMITGKMAKMGPIYLFHLMGILSASLAIFNLLPLPVLDGGHIVFLAIEKIRRRPISPKVQEFITNLGIVFLIALTIFIFYGDMAKFGMLDKISSIIKK